MKSTLETQVTTIYNFLKQQLDAIAKSWNQFWFVPGDPAVLGLLRICVGAIALYMHGTLAFDLITLFGPEGIIPSKLVTTEYLGPLPSYLHFIHSTTALWTVHVLGGFVLLLFTLGVRTRVTGLLSLLVVLATIHRAPMLAAEVENVLPFALLYLCIGPCGQRFSLGSWFQKEPSERSSETPTTTISLRLMQLHTVLVTAMMALAMLITFNATWWSGEAIWYLIARPESQTFDLSWLADHAYLLNAWTHSVVLYLVAFSLLIWKRWARPWLLVLGIPHWLLLAIATGLYPFCLLMLSLSLAFLPQKIEPQRARRNTEEKDRV